MGVRFHVCSHGDHIHAGFPLQLDCRGAARLARRVPDPVPPEHRRSEPGGVVLIPRAPEPGAPRRRLAKRLLDFDRAVEHGRDILHLRRLARGELC